MARYGAVRDLGNSIGKCLIREDLVIDISCLTPVIGERVRTLSGPLGDDGAIRLLQKAAGCYQDGLIGPITVATVNLIGAPLLIELERLVSKL